jgi:16S rRNA (cytidine1402-2'-O)-methyltransferase
MANNKKGQLFLIPSTLGSDHALPFLAPSVIEEVLLIDHFIVENVRSARRFLKKCNYSKNFDDVVFYELNNRTKASEYSSMLNPLKKGVDMGLISEAGVPAVADPGSEIVAIAHENNIRVRPLVGPSSILLALMASGLNGQGFTFNGYLPRKENERIKALKHLEFLSKKTGFTQIFMDTPYRNIALLENIVENLSPYTQLCIAVNLTLPDEKILTQEVEKWRKSNISLDKKPAMFLLQAH